MRAPRDPRWWHLPLLIGISAAYELRFIAHGINTYDEGWPLYAAMRLHQGGVLYDDVFFVFPPGHVLAAWIGYGLDAPGLILTRQIYAAWNVALCVGIYELGRKLMPPAFALLGAFLFAIAAPFSHGAHLLFGYRYLALTVPALLAFHRRLRTGDSRWMLAAGLATGVAVVFRLTPAFAVGAALGLASVAADRSWRSWLKDWSWLGAGILAVLLPVLAWFESGVGLAAVWREVIVRPLSMLQPLPIPDLLWWGWWGISATWVAVQFWIYPVLYAGYIVALVAQWLRALQEGRRFEHAFLLAVVLWGGIFFLRATGRADIAHLESAIPPICLLIAYLLHVAGRRIASDPQRSARESLALRGSLCAAVVAVWIFVPGVDRAMDPIVRGAKPFPASGELIYMVPGGWSRGLG